MSQRALLAGFSAWALAGGVAGAQSAEPPILDRDYRMIPLVSDLPGVAPTTDSLLVNPWGVAFDPTGAFWLNDNGTGVSTLYDGQGHKIPVTFVVPPPAGAQGPSAPTGMIWNPTSGFLVPGTKLPAVFVFSTEDGTISAWAPGEPTNPLDAVLAVDNSKSGAVYKGLEFGVTAKGGFLYATNFHSGKVDVFDKTFAPANAQLQGSFSDPQIPYGYGPFGIRNINGNLVVTYAKQNAKLHDDVAGAGHGYVDIFDTDGRLLQRLAGGGALNSPWGVALAPAGFGRDSNDLLIGNFGDGRINAYSPGGTFLGPLRTAAQTPIVIPGLWGLYFGGAANSEPRTLYFTAGLDHEAHGLFGAIVQAIGTPSPASGD